MTKIIELVLECPICEGMMVVKMSGECQIKELFQPCSVCKILEKVA